MLQPDVIEPNATNPILRQPIMRAGSARSLARRSGVVLAFLLAVNSSACGIRLRSPIQTKPDPVGQASAEPPKTFIHSTSDSRSTRLVEVRDGSKKDALFRTVSNLLAQRNTVDVSDERAGFLMTTWQTGLVRDGVPDLHYRTRVVIRFLGDDWKQVAVRAEANWQRGEEWDVGYDIGLLESLAAELRASIGKPPN